MILNGWTPSGYHVPATPRPNPKDRPVSLVKRYTSLHDRVIYSEGFTPPRVPTFKKEEPSE